MRAVVDTNILVSGLLRAGSLPAAVLSDIVHGRLTPVVCGEILAEYREVLRRPRLGLHGGDVDAFVALVEHLADHVRVPPYIGALNLPDPTDWPFLACALAADCALITGNARHFPARLGARVVTARQWSSRE